MRILLAPNLCRDPQLRCARRAQKILRELGAETRLCPLFAADLEKTFPPPEQLAAVDLVIAFGGDGTFLYAAKWASAYHIPVLGVNLGRTGFLAGISRRELAMLRRLTEGQYHVDEHMMLQAVIWREEQCLGKLVALNDIVLGKNDLTSAVDLSVSVDGEQMFRAAGDGVITATPTGSTAYALSAGGPVMEHTLQSIMVTPICPHRLGVRTYVLQPERAVSVMVEPRRGTEVLLSVDGQKAQVLQGKDRVEICRADQQAQLIRLKDADFYAALRQKIE